ncbi:aminopeptidase N [Agromyces seonyuensis]|uniref:Aminopeptidase N n=1 Tax=Agromyces seonyuensis TaxID=2662446 RepID=A0A6I4NT34_9MICO|nr:aminopeptidase N [Agromyces seonyuensis]MWB97360.1 aminopeptidase N [Agromyces seonyuensis]
MRRPLTRLEAEARAELLTVHGTDIVLDVTGEGPTFRSTTTVRFAARAGASTFIEANARVDRVELNGRVFAPHELEAAVDGARIALAGLADENVLVVAGDFAYSHTGEGLHRFVDPVDERVYLYTQFAVAFAQNVFAVFDQPDLKTRFALTVTAPSSWLVRSNSPVASIEPVEGAGAAADASIHRFEPTPVMSSYIVALAAGEYAERTGTATTRSGREVPLGLYTRASLAQYGEPDVMFGVLDRGIRFYEDAYDVDFPYAKYDQIFVPEYNWGAMENIGAVTFNEGYLFRSRVPEARLERRATVILHELAHMWFGDLVTMRWWNDTWLNESFATWASTLAASETTEFADAWATFATNEKTDAAAQDQLPSTHPVVAIIDDTAQTEVNFDAITYDKGASVLKQLVAFVGLESFHAGVGAYLRKHANGNATLADLLAELEDASGRDLSTWSALWLETAGVNTLRTELETDADGVITSFAVLQTAADSHPVLRPHRLAVGGYSRVDGSSDPAAPIERVLRIEFDLDGERTEVPELIGQPRPDVLLLNDDDLTYAKIRLDEASTAVLIASLDSIDSALARAVAWGSLWDATRDGELPATDYVRLALANVGRETQSNQRALVLGQLELVLGRYLAPGHRDAVAAEAGDALWALAGLAEPGSDAQLQFVKSFTRIASTAGHTDLLESILDGSLAVPGLPVDTDLRWDLVIALASLGAADEDAIAAALALDDTAKGRQFADTARAARPTREAKDAAWRRVVGDERITNDEARAVAAGWRIARPASLLAPSIAAYFDALQSAWANRGFTIGTIIARSLYPAPYASAELAAASRAWLEANVGPDPLVRLVSEQHSELERALRAQVRDAEALASTER